MERLTGLRSTSWLLRNSHREVRYSPGNVANDILMAVCGARWVLTQPPRCTSETDTE